MRLHGHQHRHRKPKIGTEPFYGTYEVSPSSCDDALWAELFRLTPVAVQFTLKATHSDKRQPFSRREQHVPLSGTTATPMPLIIMNRLVKQVGDRDLFQRNCRLFKQIVNFAT
jgi:hypothetical protein